ncbi:MAG: hypothetical protein ACI8YQ_002670 [Polaribacter sp.]
MSWTDLKDESYTLTNPEMSVYPNPKMSVYPNPANDELYVKNVLNGTDVSLYNLYGELVKVMKYQNYLNVSWLPSGVYFLTINTESIRQSTLFIKE